MLQEGLGITHEEVSGLAKWWMRGVHSWPARQGLAQVAAKQM